MAEPTLYLFDGYNLLHSGSFGDRRELTDTLASYVAVRGARGILVWDGAGADSEIGPLSVRHAPHADALLERLAAEHRAGEEVCLVSSDFAVRGTSGQEVQKRSSRTFLAELEQPRHGESSGTRLGDSLDAETRARLERLRRGLDISGRPLSRFASDLRTCLSEMLGAPVPEPAEADDPVLFFKQWLAERNLGLVPIDDAGAFDWPGQWIAVFRDGQGEHALLMFGSPSGVWLDPSNAYSEAKRIEAGWMLAPLDLHLPSDPPYGTAPPAGTVAAILVTAHAEAPLSRVEQAEALAGRGLAGDRYAAGRGTFSGPGRGYQLTLVEAKVLDEIELSWEQARRNIVTRDISLNGLVGRRFRVGSAECVGRRLCEPCAHLEKLARPGLLRPLVHRGGLRADITKSGVVRLGDEIEAID